MQRLLLLSKHFPPSEEAGALRWQKLTVLAEEHGYAVTVATRHYDELERRDDRRLRELPGSTQILQVKSVKTAFDAFETATVSLRRAIRSVGSLSFHAGAETTEGDQALPPVNQSSVSRVQAPSTFASLGALRRAYHATALRASELAWAKAAGRQLSRIPDAVAVVSCGPPHQVHIVGAEIAKRRRVPHVVDMRDPWSMVERVPASFGSKRLWEAAARDETHVFGSAALVVVNTEAHAAELRSAYPSLSDRIVAVLNGFDDEVMPPPEPQRAFTIVYAGTIYLDRDPAVLLEPVAEMVRRAQVAPDDLQLIFVGDVESGNSAGLAGMASSLGIGEFVQVRGRVPRAEAMQLLSRADLNVVLPQDSHLAVPSKVYEYLRFPAWLLALAEPHSATARTLAGTGADVVLPGDDEAVIRVISARMAERQRSGRPRPLAEAAPHLSRRAQAELLFRRVAATVKR